MNSCTRFRATSLRLVSRMCGAFSHHQSTTDPRRGKNRTCVNSLKCWYTRESMPPHCTARSSTLYEMETQRLHRRSYLPFTGAVNEQGSQDLSPR